MSERVFELYPAIDLRGGRVVRLRQGVASTEMRFSSDPVAVARQFAEAGAAALHVIDLDGAFAGAPAQLSTVARICRVSQVPVRLGGGLRREQDLDAAFSAGIAVAIVGTTAVEDPERFRGWVSKFEGRLAASVDVRGGLVRTRGWVSETAFRLEDAAVFLAGAGVRDLIVTDVERDGELSGPDLDLFRRTAEAFGSPVIAAGGISSAEDVERLRAEPSIRGAVLGRALYEGRIPLSVFAGAS